MLGTAGRRPDCATGVERHRRSLLLLALVLDEQHRVALFLAEVLDVGADGFADAQAKLQEDRMSRCSRVPSWRAAWIRRRAWAC